jgi:hypothetical protein
LENATFDDEFEETATTELNGDVEMAAEANEPADSDDEGLDF